MFSITFHLTFFTVSLANYNILLFTFQDFFGYVNVSLMHALKFDFSPYPKILAWFKRISELPFYEKTCKVPMENVFLAYKEKLKESI